MKFIIAGRVGSGKTTLAKHMEAQGLRLAKSNTTRPRRPNEEDDYIFITKEEAAKYPESERFVSTKRNDYEYFMAKEEVLKSDIFVVDPNGIRDITRELPEEKFVLVYIRPISSEVAQKFHDDRDPGGKSYAERSAAEDKLFTELEGSLIRRDFRSQFYQCYNIVNNYEGNLASWAEFFTGKEW